MYFEVIVVIKGVAFGTINLFFFIYLLFVSLYMSKMIIGDSLTDI